MKEYSNNLKNVPYLSPLIKAYLNQENSIMNIADFKVDISDIELVIKDRTENFKHRAVLNSVLKKQYEQLPQTPQVQHHLELLKLANSFTITTAHQPNLLTGPNYFIIKILETVGLCQYLTGYYPQFNFVPVFYMGSEDADFEELNNVQVFSEKLIWNTNQTGAFGRMIIDQKFIQILQRLENIIATNHEGKELIEKMKKHYQINKTVQDATLHFVHDLFGKYGLIILCPDNAELKKTLLPIAYKELAEQSSGKVFDEITKKNFPFDMTLVWREINFFILENQQRHKIKLDSNSQTFQVGENKYNLEELSEKITKHPELISPNVVLRPVFQELILPNVIFVGGGGEISYWLQLSDVFKSYGMKLPILKLRNSHIFIKNNLFKQWLKLEIPMEYIFKNIEEIKHYFLYHLNDYYYDLSILVEKQESLLTELQTIFDKHDKSLEKHLNNVKSDWKKTMINLETKIKRSQKRKELDSMNVIEKMKHVCFPKNILQERIINFSEIYLNMGNQMFEHIIEQSKQLESKFNIITY